MLDATSTICWRWTQGENSNIAESNIFRRSDGLTSPQLDTEVFDISTNVNGAPPTTSISTCSSQSQTQPKPVAPKHTSIPTCNTNTQVSSNVKSHHGIKNSPPPTMSSATRTCRQTTIFG
ncbi:hypothetical protein BDV93DRAFT_548526 [Ceratobasidium sp. AG-I]|nr:hypothetical protein BDV93DRAFT_548526 [Ceratobasidium sp. AG-I]